ncbi:MAG: hypothetical protein OXC62_05495 [Aestuariivita sp.]|nr:hypothetical protein [Aestuariivita sp.]
MNLIILRIAPIFLFSIALSSNAQADLSVHDVWSAWRNFYTESGFKFKGQEQISNNEITIDDATLTAANRRNTSSIEIKLGTLKFSKDKNAVNISLANEMPITIIEKSDSKEVLEASLIANVEDFEMSADGSPSEIRFRYSASAANITLNKLKLTSLFGFSSTPRLKITQKNIAGTTLYKNMSLAMSKHTISGDLTTMDIFLSDSSKDYIAFVGSNDHFLFESTGASPMTMQSNIIFKQVEDGYNSEGKLKIGPLSLSLATQENQRKFSLQSSAETNSLSYNITSAGIHYTINQSNLTYSIIDNQLPFPILANTAQIALELLFPIFAAEKKQDFNLLVNLDSITLKDEIWDQFDPQNNILRYPANLIIDITGQLQLQKNLYEIETNQSTFINPQLPTILHTLNFNEIMLNAFDAGVRGTGNFSFDNKMQPIGSLDLEITGSNQLLDKFVEIGVIQLSEVFLIRSMLSLFTIPGNDQDILSSRIEINDKGQIFANGQRLQ